MLFRAISFAGIMFLLTFIVIFVLPCWPYMLSCGGGGGFSVNQDAQQMKGPDAGPSTARWRSKGH